ncbi:unnamed protein product [Paramecium pentaurelia]|uniref:TLDc domain-containing protein n=1 Tax=Paramecium pentaurelia TaxID=43138 RepID=A0A8S1XTS1_9CILI|nr:unnamed protein product [Paramecium pentaurelia]
MQQQDLQQSERNDSQIHKKSPEIHEFISKCQLQDSYISIFNESVDLQMELQKEVNNLQQQGQLEQLTQLESDNNNQNAQFSQMQQQYKQFEINSEKMKKLIKAEENYEQLKIIKQQKEDLQQQIEDEKLVFQQIQQKITCLEENMTASIQMLNQQVSKQEQQQQDFLQQINQEIVTNNKLKDNLQELSNSSEQKLQQLATKYDDLNQYIDEAQQEIYGMKNSTLLQDKLQQLENSIDTKQKAIHEKIEELSSNIEKKNIEQCQKLQQEKQELLKKINEEKIETNIQIEQQNNQFKQIIKENKDEFTKQEKSISSVAQSIKEENWANAQLKKEIKEFGDQNQKGISQLAIKIDNQSKELIKINSEMEFWLRDKIIQYHLKTRQFRGLKIIYEITQKTKKTIKGSRDIYLGTRDGLKAEYFWQKAYNLENLFMVFKSKSGYIFGAYSPFKWDYNGSSNKQDNTLSSFIFSQNHQQEYHLKEDKKNQAIHCDKDYGPSYGNYDDIKIAGDFIDGYSRLGTAYQFSSQKGNSNNPFLFGQEKPEIQNVKYIKYNFVEPIILDQQQFNSISYYVYNYELRIFNQYCSKKRRK